MALTGAPRSPVRTPRSHRTRRVAVRALVVVAGLLATLVPALQAHGQVRARTVLSDGFQSHPLGTDWSDGSVHGNWRTRFDGYGEVGIQRDGTKVLYAAPTPPTGPNDTHASLVTTRATFEDVRVKARVKTVRHLRSGDPNPWEVGWVLWRYTDNTHFYYLILKPNGWELGKADPAYPGAQRFLLTGSDRRFPIGRWYEVKVRHVGSTITFWVDGVRLGTFTDEERPYERGAIGLYTEDAAVRFDDVAVATL